MIFEVRHCCCCLLELFFTGSSLSLLVFVLSFFFVNQANIKWRKLYRQNFSFIFLSNLLNYVAIEIRLSCSLYIYVSCKLHVKTNKIKEHYKVFQFKCITRTINKYIVDIKLKNLKFRVKVT